MQYLTEICIKCTINLRVLLKNGDQRPDFGGTESFCTFPENRRNQAYREG